MKITKKSVIGKRFSKLTDEQKAYLLTEAKTDSILRCLISENASLTRSNYLIWNGVTESEMGVEYETDLPWIFTKPQPRSS